MKTTIENRFWSKVTKTKKCWIFNGAGVRGYGFFYHSGTKEMAHRFSYSLKDPKFDRSKLVCHHCDNPPCVRPDHLFVGTVGDNTRDAAKKGRLYVQTNNPSPYTNRTHCKHGHEYSKENSYVKPNGGYRVCRACVRRHASKAYYKKRAKFRGEG